MPIPAFARVPFAASLALSLSLILAGCAGSGSEAKTDDAKSNKGEAAPNKSGEPIAGKPVEGEGKVGVAPGGEGGAKEYNLEIDKVTAKVGEESKVSVRVVPQGEWHMNLEYPTKLEVNAPAGLTIAKPKLAKADAVKLDEQSCEFAIALTPDEAGSKTVTGEFKFAICQDEACVPKTETLTFEVAVE